MDNNLENKLKELKQAYLQKLEGILLDLKKIFQELPTLDIEELYSQVHKISGTSGMYGLRELSGFSSEFEFFLKELKKDSNIESPELLKKNLLKYIQIIEQELKQGNSQI